MGPIGRHKKTKTKKNIPAPPNANALVLAAGCVVPADGVKPKPNPPEVGWGFVGAVAPKAPPNAMWRIKMKTKEREKMMR
jgi:hypothetical protein